MSRTHLFELEDQPWFPAVLRDAGTAYLRFVIELSGHAALLTPKLLEAFERSGEKRLLDLCSGGGGAIPVIVDALARDGHDVRARLTDFFPNLPAFDAIARASEGRIDYETKSIDATAVPRELEGFRTIFNAFHHFRPEMGRRILADAVAARRPIALFEVVSREPLPFFGMLFSPLQVLLLMPFVKPRRWSWLFFTYVVPVIPFFVLWDGIVSWLRIYSEAELHDLVAGIDAKEWRWDIGRIKLGRAPAHATYLIGMPAR